MRGAGDPAAVGQLFERFHGRVAGYLGRLVHWQEVEDLVQLTFLQLARGKT
ncbi:MAG: hypothetical protein H6721_31435 [Sandaracinus sp.]|nr:hypothetical protein [Sandaracinus sp.]